jgi:hypothetical protein
MSCVIPPFLSTIIPHATISELPTLEQVSCSWGADDDDDPYLIEAVDAWLQARAPCPTRLAQEPCHSRRVLQAGIVPVFAVGNSGPDCDSVASPSDYPGAFFLVPRSLSFVAYSLNCFCLLLKRQDVYRVKQECWV